MAKRELQNTLDLLAEELVNDIFRLLRDAIRDQGAGRLGLRRSTSGRATGGDAPSAASARRGRRKAAKKAGRSSAPARQRDKVEQTGSSGAWAVEAVTDPEALLGALANGGGTTTSPASTPAEKERPRRTRARTRSRKLLGEEPRAARGPSGEEDKGKGAAAPTEAPQEPPAEPVKPALREDEVAVRSRGGNLVIRRGRGPMDEPTEPSQS